MSFFFNILDPRRCTFMGEWNTHIGHSQVVIFGAVMFLISYPEIEAGKRAIGVLIGH